MFWCDGIFMMTVRNLQQAVQNTATRLLDAEWTSLSPAMRDNSLSLNIHVLSNRSQNRTSSNNNTNTRAFEDMFSHLYTVGKCEGQTNRLI